MLLKQQLLRKSNLNFLNVLPLLNAPLNPLLAERLLSLSLANVNSLAPSLKAPPLRPRLLKLKPNLAVLLLLPSQDEDLSLLRPKLRSHNLKRVQKTEEARANLAEDAR